MRSAAPPHVSLARAFGRGWRVELVEVQLQGAPWYRCTWHQTGRTRARRGYEGRNLDVAQRRFAEYVKGAQNGHA